MNSDQFEIRKIDSPQDLFALEKIWLELQAPVTLSNFGSTFAMVRTAWETLSSDQDRVFGYNRQLLTLLISQNNVPIAIAPFIKVCRDKKIGLFTKQLTSIEFLMHPLLARHIRFFYDIVTNKSSPQLTQAILDWLYRNERFDIIHLAYISEDSPNFVSTGREMLFSLTSSIVYPKNFSNFEEYRRRIYSESLRQNLRTALNRARGQSLTIDVTMHEANNSVLSEVTELARTKLDADKFFRTGYHEFLLQACGKSGADVVCVRANDRLIAYRTYLKIPGGRFEIDTHRNLDYLRLELGSLLIDKAIEDSFAKGLTIHSEGLYGGIHTERFASRALAGYKWLSPGNTLWGGITERAIRDAHIPEHPVVQPFLRDKNNGSL